MHPSRQSMVSTLRSVVIAFAVLLLPLASALNLYAQVPSRAQVPLAVSGQPFGVLTVEIPLPSNWNGRTPRVILSDDEGRLFYPVVSIVTAEVREAGETSGGPRIGRPGGLIDRVRNVVQSAGEKREVPVGIQIHSLFRGNQDLKVRLQGDLNQQLVFAVDEGRDVKNSRLMNSWWKAYTNQHANVIAGDDVPKLIHYYLTSMLAKRLDLPLPDLDPPDSGKSKEKNQPLETLALLAAIEPLREEVLKKVLTQPSSLNGELPLPAEPTWQPTQMPPISAEVQLEEIAGKIPPECFYVRFGSFNNYLWFQELAERFGGDLTQAFFLRGFNYESTKRIERTLAAKLTTVAKLFGDKLVGDMALFGCDLYMNEGASLGVVFHANNPGLLRSAIEADRKSVIGKNPDAKLRDVTIDGTVVSLLSTPDNRVRSFFFIDNNYVVLTSSEYLVRRYLQVAHGEPSLASTDTYRWARTWMPEANGYSVFAYLSPDFFHRLVSPQYQIELKRRLEAIAHLELADVASLAARAEGIDASESIANLKQTGLLPPWFDERADGSKILRSGDRWIDAVRGARGSFLPISDVKIQTVSKQEADEYARIAQYYQHQWRKMDPIIFGVRRFQGENPKLEKVVFEGHIAPFEPTKYGWIARQLADPSTVEIRQPADDAASIQCHVRGENPGESYYFFAGVKDMVPPEPEDVKGLLKTFRALKSAPAYIGAWPKPSLIELLPLGLGATLARPDAAGFAKIVGGLWRWQNEQWSLLSFDRSILEKAIPQLGTVESSDNAQMRLTVSNLQGTKLEKWINQLWWERGWRASHGNAVLMDTMHQQLKIPNHQCLEVANRLMDVKLQCPLGGSYQCGENSSVDSSQQLWQSTAWTRGTESARGKPRPPDDYSAPWIQWFRGGKVEAVQQSSALSIVGLLHLELPPVPISSSTDKGSSQLPQLNFDIFSLPMKMFGGGTGEDAKSKEKGGDKNKDGATLRKSF